MKLEPPPILRDVYRDMRDRRLIWIALALVVAIVAVPILLGGSDPEVPAGATATADTPPVEGVEQIEPVVLTDVPGLRDFQERLKSYQSRNPFKQQLAAPEASETTGGSGGSAAGSLEVEPAAEVADPIGGEVTPASEPSVSVPIEPDPVDPGVPADPDQPDEEEEVDALITYRLDVRVGPVGDTKVLENVKSLSILPERKNGVVQYVESDIDGEAASFIVSPDADVLKGDGKCGPTRADCEFLLMKPGDDQEFRYGPGRRVYRLELLDINRHIETLRSGEDAEKRVQPGYDAETGLSNLTGGWALQSEVAGYDPAP